MAQSDRIQELMAMRARAQSEMQQAELALMGVSANGGPQGASLATDEQPCMLNCYVRCREGDSMTFPLIRTGRLDGYVIVPKEDLLSLARDVESGAVDLGEMSASAKGAASPVQPAPADSDDRGYVRNCCLIGFREGEKPLFTQEGDGPVVARLDGYYIVATERMPEFARDVVRGAFKL